MSLRTHTSVLYARTHTHGHTLYHYTGVNVNLQIVSSSAGEKLVSLCPPDTVNVVYVTCSLHVNSQRWLMSSGWGWVPSETCVSLCNHRLAQPAVIIVFHGQWGGDLWKDSPHCYEVSAWLGDWNLAADDHENNRTKNFLLRWSVIVSVPCHIWRLSQPAPGQVSPPHPARYQTLETNRGKRKRWVSVNKFQDFNSCEVRRGFNRVPQQTLQFDDFFPKLVVMLVFCLIHPCFQS